jgi:hypothetical protein
MHASHTGSQVVRSSERTMAGWERVIQVPDDDSEESEVEKERRLREDRLLADRKAVPEVDCEAEKERRREDDQRLQKQRHEEQREKNRDDQWRRQYRNLAAQAADQNWYTRREFERYYGGTTVKDVFGMDDSLDLDLLATSERSYGPGRRVLSRDIGEMTRKTKSGPTSRTAIRWDMRASTNFIDLISGFHP